MMEQPPFILVYRCGESFVTDAHEPIEVTDTETGAHVTTIGRYGVWARQADGTHEVIHTTDDLPEAQRLCDESGRPDE